MTKYMTLVPAYGRDYKSAKEVKADWEAGKDFVIMDVTNPYSGKYVNKQDAPKGVTLNIRYKNMANVCVIKN